MANWFQKIAGSVTENVAEVDGNNQLLIRPARVLSKTGYVGLAGISGYTGDEGDVATAQKILASMNYRMYSGLISTQFEDVFDATSQNTAIWKWYAVTMTGAQAGGLLTLNNSGLTTININAAFQTFRTFPLFGNNELRFSMTGGFNSGSSHVANVVTEFGIMSITGLPAATAPYDGVFFRFNASNELRGVCVNNSVETQTGAITAPTVGVLHEWEIVVTNYATEFWIDGVLQATLTLTTDAPTQAVPFQAQHPITIRMVNTGSAPATAVKLVVGSVRCQYNGFDTVRPWTYAMAGMGRMLSQNQNGASAMGSTALNVNNQNPGTAVPTNTTSAVSTGLGGLAQETLTLAAASDGIINSYQVPAGTVANPAKNLVITGVTISGVVTVALTTQPLTGILSLCYGHTAVSLATAEAGTFSTPTTKAPRKIALCTTAVLSATAAAGTPVSGPVPITFNSPIVVGPGEFVAIAHKKVSTAPGAGSIMWTIMYDGYWE